MWIWVLGAAGLLLLAVVVYDLLQPRHAILRNFPIVGHFRYLFEAVGPELRQYIVTSNDEERPFSRDQRSWIYASAKGENNYFGFGTDNDLELTSNYLILKHCPFPVASALPGDPRHDPQYALPCAKVLGEHRGRRHAFRPASVVNVSAMSFGSLSAHAIQALNRGCSLAGALHNTGEGGISRHHLMGGELVWQIGTGYFGCRDDRGRFSLNRLLEGLEDRPVRALEVKLSQGAKPGKGGVLPRAKITPEIAQIRGIPRDRDCISPSAHSAFTDTDSMLDFVESLAEATGLPVGIKSAVGELEFWSDLGRLMARGDRGVDFITIDGGEGGTGAAPLVFSDHVALPFKLGMARVYRELAHFGVHHQVVFIGGGRLGFPEEALLAMALGCDLINVAREAMLAIGCIQAQRCHTGRCPTGVTTQNRWLMRGLDPTLKSARLANYFVTLRKELLELSHACGVHHPALVGIERFDVLDNHLSSVPARDIFRYESDWGKLPARDRKRIHGVMTGTGDAVMPGGEPEQPAAPSIDA